MSALKILPDNFSVSANVVENKFIADKSSSSNKKKESIIIDFSAALPVVRAKLKNIVSRVSLYHLDPKIKSQLFDQIDWLLDKNEWVQGDILPNDLSFMTFIKFVLNANLLKSPYLGLSEEGMILSSCVNESGKLILECLPNEHVKYVAYCIIDNRQRRVAGDAESIEDLLELLSPFSKSGWFYDSNKSK